MGIDIRPPASARSPGRLVARMLALVVLGAVALGGCGDDGDHPPSSVPRSFFGVIPQTLLTGEDLDRMGRGRVGTLRIVIPWAAVQPTEDDEIDFTAIDGIVLGAARNGIDVLPTLYSTPTWVAEDLDGYDCDPDCGTYAPRSDAARAAWGKFVGQLAGRYGPGGRLWAQHPDVDPLPVGTWQIWNEQNSPTFYQPEPDVGAYEKLLSTSADAIRKRDPDATIVLGGLFGTPFGGKPPALTAWDFLRQLYAIPGAADEFDGVGAHPYAAHLKKVESQTRLMHDEIERADDDATMWITEIGWASSGPDVPLNRGPEGQAASLTKAFEFFLDQRLAWKIETVDWYSWRDSPESVCDWCEGSGLFELRKLEPKPAWDAFVGFTGGS